MFEPNVRQLAAAQIVFEFARPLRKTAIFTPSAQVAWLATPLIAFDNFQ